MIKLNVLIMLLCTPKGFGSFTIHQLDPGCHSGALLNIIVGSRTIFLQMEKLI